MTWYPDLGTITMIDAGEHVRAVGWLSAEQGYPVGDVQPLFLARLKEFARRCHKSARALGWGFLMGWHDCEFCSGCAATGNFGVPHRDFLFVAPEMIPHYVEIHHYRPPAEFITALMESPLPGSADYRVAVGRFRALHQQFLEQEEQRRVACAARWAHEQGATEESIARAALRYFGDDSAGICQRIRQALTAASTDR